jgi:hypothetical protein
MKTERISLVTVTIVVVYFISAIAAETMNRHGYIKAGSPTHKTIRVIYRPFAYFVAAFPGGEDFVDKVITKVAGK